MHTTEHHRATARLTPHLAGAVAATALMLLAGTGVASAMPGPDPSGAAPTNLAPAGPTTGPVPPAGAGIPLWVFLLVTAALIITTALTAAALVRRGQPAATGPAGAAPKGALASSHPSVH